MSPNIDYKYANGINFSYRICTNNHGFKSKCNLTAGKEFDVAFMGDSFVEGGIEYEKTFVGIFEEKTKLSVANLGIISYAPKIYLSKIKYLLDNNFRFKHIIVFIDISDFYDDSNYFTSKIPYSETANNYVSFEIAKIINAELNVRKKCLIVDLDNTLWGGVLGEEGLHGIDLGKTFQGECYRNFQKYLKMLQERGVILAICSKNNLSDVKDCFKKNSEMFLKFSDFSSFQINWDEKYLNANKNGSIYVLPNMLNNLRTLKTIKVLFFNTIF